MCHQNMLISTGCCLQAKVPTVVTMVGQDAAGNHERVPSSPIAPKGEVPKPWEGLYFPFFWWPMSWQDDKTWTTKIPTPFTSTTPLFSSDPTFSMQSLRTLIICSVSVLCWSSACLVAASLASAACWFCCIIWIVFWFATCICWSSCAIIATGSNAFCWAIFSAGPKQNPRRASVFS